MLSAFSTVLHRNLNMTLIPSNLSPKRECGPKVVNPFRTAVPVWGQTTLIPSELSPKRDWGPKRVNPIPGIYIYIYIYIYVVETPIADS